jgi:predicted AAA+ superfamily ATPase
LKCNLPDNPEFYASELNILWNEFLIYGGYPEITLEKSFSKKKEKLKEISSTYISKDIKDIARIDNLSAFNKLVYLLAGQIGSLVNINELSLTLQITRITLEKYLFLLENTFIIKRLQPFYSNPRKEISKMPKLFFFDNGIVNSILNDFTPVDKRYNIGHLIENAVFTQLWKKKHSADSLNYWRTQTKSEIDFVFINENNVFGIEVKAASLNKPKKFRNIESFKCNHPEYYKIIVSNSKLIMDINNYLFLTHYYL